MKKLAFVLTLLSAAAAAAQPATTTNPAQSPNSSATTLDPNSAPTLDEDNKDSDKPKEPKRGDFDAGGQARFPSGPDEAGKFASFNWVAIDLKGKYYLLKHITLNGNVPLAVKKPDTVGPMGPKPSIFGGFTLTLDARMQAPKMPGLKYETIVGLDLTFGYMKEGAMLLSDKDYPLFIGDMKPGAAVGLVTRVKLSSLLDFSFVPTWVYQKASMGSLTAIQIPMAIQIALGSLVKLNTELGIYTGDDYSFSGDKGGRITTGASLDVKLGHILLHAGAGVASLLTGGLYPTIKDSFYVDVNVKYAK